MASSQSVIQLVVYLGVLLAAASGLADRRAGSLTMPARRRAETKRPTSS